MAINQDLAANGLQKVTNFIRTINCFSPTTDTLF